MNSKTTTKDISDRIRQRAGYRTEEPKRPAQPVSDAIRRAAGIPVPEEREEQQ